MKVRFLQDYRGKLTQEQYFTKGQEVEFEDGQAAALIEAGRAVEVKAKPKKEKNDGGPTKSETGATS